MPLDRPTLYIDHAATTPLAPEVLAEMEPYLREPLSKGWKSVYGLPRIGQGTEV